MRSHCTADSFTGENVLNRVWTIAAIHDFCQSGFSHQCSQTSKEAHLQVECSQPTNYFQVAGTCNFNGLQPKYQIKCCCWRLYIQFLRLLDNVNKGGIDT